jgi:arsenate reductase (thioredoxin)
MLILGLQGSPRQDGNTAWILNTFMDEAARMGARTHIIDADKDDIRPCKEYVLCEKKGICPIKDDLYHTGYALLREADVIVAATPVFFYNMSAQLKGLIDRCQVFWARKYMLKMRDPGAKSRRGFLISVGATKGKQLFDAIELSVRYFFDAAGAAYSGSLLYRGVEKKGEIVQHPGVEEEIRQAVQNLLSPLISRPRVLFSCKENACRSQMATAFARGLFGDKMDVMSAGSHPSAKVDPVMIEAMKELGIDMGFLTPRALDGAIKMHAPQWIVTMGCGESCSTVPGANVIDWDDLQDPSGQDLDFMRRIRDQIKNKVEELARHLSGSSDS